MNNTATKNEMNVEASHPQLPVIEGRLMPWTRDRSILVEGIAKFRAAEADPLERWIAGAQFQVRSRGLLYTLGVIRFIPAKHIPERSELVRGGRYGKRWSTTPARTIPEVVVVQVLAVEPAR